MNFWNIKYSK